MWNRNSITPTNTEHLSSSPLFREVRVALSLGFCVTDSFFFPFWPFSTGHCTFWLRLLITPLIWYLQTVLTTARLNAPPPPPPPPPVSLLPTATKLMLFSCFFHYEYTYFTVEHNKAGLLSCPRRSVAILKPAQIF